MITFFFTIMIMVIKKTTKNSEMNQDTKSQPHKNGSEKTEFDT